MDLTETIERTFADVADTIESTFGSLAERSPAPADKLLSQLGQFNVEAIRQCGRATVRSMAAIEDIVRTLEDRAQGVAGKADDLRENVAARADEVVDRARDEAKNVTKTAKKAAGQARSTAKKTASKAADVVEDAVDEATDAGVRAVAATKNLSKLSKAELYELAQTADIDGRSGMTKAQLVAALKKV